MSHLKCDLFIQMDMFLLFPEVALSYSTYFCIFINPERIFAPVVMTLAPSQFTVCISVL